MSGLVDRALEQIGGISTPRMQGDNLAIILCNAFDDDSEQDENGWTEAATTGCDEVLEAIRAHVREAVEPLAARIGTLEAERAQVVAWQPIETVPENQWVLVYGEPDAGEPCVAVDQLEPRKFKEWVYVSDTRQELVDKTDQMWRIFHFLPTHWQPLPQPPEAD